VPAPPTVTPAIGFPPSFPPVNVWMTLKICAWACDVMIVSAPTSTNPNAVRSKLLHKIDVESRAGLVMMVSFIDAT